MAFIAGGLNTNGCNGETPCNCYPISETETECVTGRGHRYVNGGGYDSVNQNAEVMELMQVDIDSAPTLPGVSIFRNTFSAMADFISESIHDVSRVAENLMKGAGSLFMALFDVKPSYFGGPVYGPVVSILDEIEAGGINTCNVISDPGCTFEGSWDALKSIL